MTIQDVILARRGSQVGLLYPKREQAEKRMARLKADCVTGQFEYAIVYYKAFKRYTVVKR